MASPRNGPGISRPCLTPYYKHAIRAAHQSRSLVSSVGIVTRLRTEGLGVRISAKLKIYPFRNVPDSKATHFQRPLRIIRGAIPLLPSMPWVNFAFHLNRAAATHSVLYRKFAVAHTVRQGTQNVVSPYVVHTAATAFKNVLYVMHTVTTALCRVSGNVIPVFVTQKVSRQKFEVRAHPPFPHSTATTPVKHLPPIHHTRVNARPYRFNRTTGATVWPTHVPTTECPVRTQCNLLAVEQ